MFEFFFPIEKTSESQVILSYFLIKSNTTHHTPTLLLLRYTSSVFFKTAISNFRSVDSEAKTATERPHYKHNETRMNSGDGRAPCGCTNHLSFSKCTIGESAGCAHNTYSFKSTRLLLTPPHLAVT